MEKRIHFCSNVSNTSKGKLCWRIGKTFWIGNIRKLFSSGFKKVISSGVNSATAHKVADAVVNGATSATQKFGKCVVRGAASAGQKAAESVVNNAIDSTKKWFVGRKRSIQPSVTEPIIVPQKRMLDIDSLIDGSGIVLD